jgi:hypothetical protein
MRLRIYPLATALLVALGAHAAAAPRERGRVTFVTARRAYLDAGSVDGLRAGTVLQLERRGRPAGECKLDAVADHSASCPAAARVGDSFALPRLPPAATPARPAPPPVDETRARAALDAAPTGKVEFHGSRSASGALPVLSVSLGSSAFVTIGGGQFDQEHLDLRLSGLDLRFGGFRASASLTALYYVQRPDMPRFRPGDSFQLYVWQTEVESREIGRPFTLAVGRVWPHAAPGLAALDGAQGGWRSRSGDLEVGALAGTVPDAVTLYPTTRWLAGLYYGATRASADKDATVRLLHHEARLSLRDVGNGNEQLVLEGLAQLWMAHGFDLGAETRATLGGNDWSVPAIEAARISLGVRPVPALHGFLNLRYLGSLRFDPEGFAPGLLAAGTWYYADGNLAWDIAHWFSLRAHGGAAARSDGTTVDREYVGGELAFPTVLGGLLAGYQQEFGWDAGRTVHLQLATPTMGRVRVVARGSYFEDHFDSTNNLLRELGLYLFGEARLLPSLALRLSAMGRADLTRAPSTTEPSTGLTARVDVAGTW